MHDRFKLGLAALAVGLVMSCRESPASTPGPSTTGSARVAVTVDGQGYHPATVTIHAGHATTVVFTRTSDDGCGQQLVFPSLNIRRDLPLNTPVEVPLPAQPAGTIAFTCGMNMMRGSIVAQ
jgi:plastocyanin domain-containing protein